MNSIELAWWHGFDFTNLIIDTVLYDEYYSEIHDSWKLNKDVTGYDEVMILERWQNQVALVSHDKKWHSKITTAWKPLNTSLLSHISLSLIHYSDNCWQTEAPDEVD